MVPLFRVISLGARRRHWLSSEELTIDNVFLHVRADTCIHDYSSIPAIALRLLRSPVLRLVGVVVWAHAHCNNSGLLSLERSKAQRQTQKKCNMNNIFSKRAIDSATAKSSTTGLSRRPIVVAATRFRPLSESRPRHCRNTFPDDDDFYDHDVDTPSVWLSFFFVCLRKAWKHLVENCAFRVEKCALLVEVCAFFATSLVGTFLLLRGFSGALRGVGGRLSQFCGTVAHFASNDDPQPGAVRDEVVELQPSFEHLPPVLSSSRVFQWHSTRC